MSRSEHPVNNFFPASAAHVSVTVESPGTSLPVISRLRARSAGQPVAWLAITEVAAGRERSTRRVPADTQQKNAAPRNKSAIRHHPASTLQGRPIQ
jgi:hypothetical protein